MAPPKLSVHVMRCDGLESQDTFSKTDAYVRLTAPGNSAKPLRTRTIDNNNSPRYNEQFNLLIPVNEIRGGRVLVEILDAGTFSDTVFGSQEILLDQLPRHQDQEITLPWKGTRGTVTLKVRADFDDGGGAPQQQQQQQPQYRGPPTQSAPPPPAPAPAGPYGGGGGGGPYAPANFGGAPAFPTGGGGGGNPYSGGGGPSPSSYAPPPPPPDTSGSVYSNVHGAGSVSSAPASLLNNTGVSPTASSNNPYSNNPYGSGGGAGGAPSYPGAPVSGTTSYPSVGGGTDIMSSLGITGLGNSVGGGYPGASSSSSGGGGGGYPGAASAVHPGGAGTGYPGSGAGGGGGAGGYPGASTGTSGYGAPPSGSTTGYGAPPSSSNNNNSGGGGHHFSTGYPG